VNPGSVVKLEIYWDYFGDPTIKTIDNSPSTGKNYSHNYSAFTSPATKNITIRYIAYSGQNCVQYIDRVISIDAMPQIQFDPVAGICQDVPAFQITQASVVNGLTGNGTFSGPGVSSTGTFDPSAAGAGNHTIRYTFTSTNGCTDYKEQTVNVFALPIVDAGPDRFLLQNGSIVLAATATGSGLTYLWTPNLYISNVNILRPTVSPPTDQGYSLKVTTSNGCTANDSVMVKILKGLVIPNIFSPNGDGVHDSWDIPYLSSYQGCIVEVYNRYGQLIYRSIGYNTPWDGTVNGKQVPVGTYYYIIDPKNGHPKMSGWVDVIR
jgi:gliding motility-associated-like protein